MSIRATHTYAVLEVTETTYREVRELLADAGWDHMFHKDDGGEVIDMNGAALQAGAPPPDPKWIEFHECVRRTPTAKTKTWAVRAKEGGAVLGTVKWFGRWRRYAFFPEPTTVYEPTCLRDIAAFCEAETRKRRPA